jgi:hypothetical protein
MSISDGIKQCRLGRAQLKSFCFDGVMKLADLGTKLIEKQDDNVEKEDVCQLNYSVINFSNLQFFLKRGTTST